MERWHRDICGLFSGLQENPEFAFDEVFYQQIVEKKAEFENLTFEEQIAASTYDATAVNADFLFSEVSKAIDNVQLGKKSTFLEQCP